MAKLYKKYIRKDAGFEPEELVEDIEAELERLKAVYKDPQLLMQPGNTFRTPFAFYRVE